MRALQSAEPASRRLREEQQVAAALRRELAAQQGTRTAAHAAERSGIEATATRALDAANAARVAEASVRAELQRLAPGASALGFEEEQIRAKLVRDVAAVEAEAERDEAEIRARHDPVRARQELLALRGELARAVRPNPRNPPQKSSA